MSLAPARFVHAAKRPIHGFAITCAAVATLAAVTANAAPAVPAEMLRPVAAASSITEIAAKAARASATYEPELMRSRAVQPDIYLLMQTAARLTLAPGAGNAIRVGFFDDTALVVDFTSAQQVGDRTVLSGSVPGIVRGTATFVVKNGTVVGNVHALDRVYQLRFRDGDFGNGVIHESREIDPSQFRDHDRNYNAFVKQEAARERKAAMVAESNDRVAAKGAGTMKSQSTEVARDDGSVVDMLVAYTTSARIGAGGTAAINSLIELAIAESNVAYQNSSVVHRLRLLKTLEVDYVETGASSTDLGRLRGKTDKFADEVHAYRAAYGADIVSLFVERMDDACGIGYLMTNVSAAFAVSAFNVVARRCVSGTFTFAHEVGHNMGLRHDTFEDSGTTPFPDAHGYVELTARYRTVMAYNDACVAQGFSCRRTANFSNPDILVDGVPSGVLGTANAARVLNATRTTAANFVQAADLSNGGPILLVKTSYSGAEGTTVQMVVERISGAPGAASVRYATVAGTATAGVDFAPNSGTISWGVGDFAPKTISLVLLQDSIVEASEFFTVVLSDAVGATLGSSKTATIAILDDEPGVFPPNCAMPSGWTNSAGDSTLGWVVAVDSSNEGRCSLKSGPIGDSGSDTVKTTSRIAVTGDYLAGTIRFARRVSSEDTFDCFRFTIDGVQQNVGGQCSEAGGIGPADWLPDTV